jgi:hypothetical protein
MIQRRLNALIANRAAVLRELRAMKADKVLDITQSAFQIQDLACNEPGQPNPPTQPEPS